MPCTDDSFTESSTGVLSIIPRCKPRVAGGVSRPRSGIVPLHFLFGQEKNRVSNKLLLVLEAMCSSIDTILAIEMQSTAICDIPKRQMHKLFCAVNLGTQCGTP